MPLRTIDPADHIYVDTYEKLVKDIDSPDLRYCSTESIHSLFSSLRDGEQKPFTLVSGCCDFGLYTQEDNHPNNDLYKMACAFSWAEVGASREFYHSLTIGPACERDRCNPKDKYVLKADRFAASTFDDVPDSVKQWYCANLNVKHPRIGWLPFGLNNDGDGSKRIAGLVGRPKKGTLYVNFQDYTLERIQWKAHFYRQPWATTRLKTDLPVEQFLAEIAEHRYVLCPPGNGLDCYRIYECIYMGSIPVMEDSIFARHFLEAKLPVLVVDSYSSLSPTRLNGFYPELLQREYDYSQVTMSYWKKRFEEAA